MKLARAVLLFWIAGVWVLAPALADEELDQLRREFNEAQQKWSEAVRAAEGDEGALEEAKLPPHPSKEFAPRFRAYAEAHAGKAGAIDALIWLIGPGSWSTAEGEEPPAKWAFARLERDHVGDPAITDILQHASYAAYQVGKEPLQGFLKKVIEKNPDVEARAWAFYSLGVLEVMEVPKPDGAAEKTDPQAALKLFRRVMQEYPQAKATERAAGYIFEVENLQVGMKAPDFSGEDADGKAINLAQFRGKVVVVAFWGFW